ncbi:unnamed protein product [Brassicogethes aeneus]|uniref:C2H2-type domain-containing protein n=1 Tax=Brassicogethes aeneus TaxID=1431903 RepID=A0A9P0FKW9_BRAAE|nr:unnamed protein product [Brassicogethes aeneus]
MFQCNICHNNDITFAKFIQHLKIFHAHNQTYNCGLSSCGRTFSNIYSLKKHFQKHHRYQNSYNLFLDKTCSNDNAVIEAVIHQNKSQDEPSTSVKVFPSTIPSASSANININVFLKFIAKLYCKNSVARSVVQEVIEEASEIFSSIGDQMNMYMSEIFLKYNVSDEDVKKGNSLIKSISAPFQGLETEYLRLKYFETSQLFFKPTLHTICELQGPRHSRGLTTHSIQPCTLQLIPVGKVLKGFLEVPGIFDQIEEYIFKMNNRDGVISSILQGNLWKNISDRFGDRFVIPLYIYFDEFETGNPLGSRAGIHKLGGVYFSIAAIPPEFSSRLENIFLAQIFETRYMKMFTNQEIFNPLINELKKLESDGITVNLKSGEKQIYFYLAAVLGDNLGLNSILGFNEGFNSKHYCRCCRLDKETCQKAVREDSKSFRTIINYAQDLLKFECGVKSRCVWNDLKYFDNTVNVSVDIMHDIQEGICRYNMGYILNHLINVKHYFSLSVLNRRIEYFNHNSSDVANPPPSIKEDHVKNCIITMSASEMFSFVIYFGLIVGDLVDEDDDVWDFYLTFYDLVVTLYSRNFNDSLLSYLKELIAQHHESFIKLFHTTLKPKYHFALHYPSIIKNLGPPRYFSSIRYEGFHRISKTNAHIVTSRINLAYTVAIKHQLKLCYRLYTETGLCNNFESSAKYSIEQLGLEYKNVLATSSNNTTLYYLKWCKSNGIMYKPGQILFTNYSTVNNEPVFEKIHIICVNSRNDVGFIVSPIETIGYCRHFQSYKVFDNFQDNHLSLITSIDNLMCPFPNNIHMIAIGDSYISTVNIITNL